MPTNYSGQNVSLMQGQGGMPQMFGGAPTPDQQGQDPQAGLLALLQIISQLQGAGQQPQGGGGGLGNLLAAKRGGVGNMPAASPSLGSNLQQAP